MTKLRLRQLPDPPAAPSETSFAQIDADGLVVQLMEGISAAELAATVGGKWVSTVDPADPTAAATANIGDLYKPAQPLRFVTANWTPSDQQSAPAPSGGDDTAALQAFYASLDPGAVVELTDQGEYNVNSLLFDDTYSYIETNGNGATFNWDTVGTLETGNDATFLLISAHGIAIHDLNINGENPDPGRLGNGALGLEGRHGISIRSTKNVDLERLDIRNIMADPIYCGMRSGAAIEELSQGVWLSDSFCGWNGRMGFGLVAGQDIIVANTDWLEIRRSCWDLEPNSVLNITRHVAFIDNTVNLQRLYGLASAGYGGYVGDVWVKGTVTTDSAFTVVVAGPAGSQRRGPVTFIGNIDNSGGAGSNANPGRAYYFGEVDGVTVQNCRIPTEDDRYMVSVQTADCTSVALSGNTCPGAVWELYQDGVGSNPSA